MDFLTIGIVAVAFIGGIVIGRFSKEGLGALSDKIVDFLVKNKDAIFDKLSTIFSKKEKKD